MGVPKEGCRSADVLIGGRLVMASMRIMVLGLAAVADKVSDQSDANLRHCEFGCPKARGEGCRHVNSRNEREDVVEMARVRLWEPVSYTHLTLPTKA